jgi:hypothetical protein
LTTFGGTRIGIASTKDHLAALPYRRSVTEN